MPRRINSDPTEFFSVVGAPYVHERRTETDFPRRLEIGVAAGGAIFCLAVMAFSLFSESGWAKLVEVANQAVK